MKRLIIPVAIATLLAGCNNSHTPVVDTAKEQQAILAADKDFCATEQQQGMAKALEKYYAADVVAIMPNSPVAIGKDAVLKQITAQKMDSFNKLVWSADAAVVASSGDLGYSWGHYQMKDKTKEGSDTIYYGVYATVWKKQADGSWKAVLDQNNNTPKP
jgi:ketosteroid isomerase-like protein